MIEMHLDEENYSYSLVEKQFNVVHEEDAIAVRHLFTTHLNMMYW